MDTNSPYTDEQAGAPETDIRTRLESAEKEIRRLRKRVELLEYIREPPRPRPDPNLAALAAKHEAIARETDGNFSSTNINLGEPQLIHHPKRLGMQLYAYSRILPDQPLFIVFHGAMVKGVWFPRFERVRSMTEAGRSFCTIADPTIQLDRALKLGWYCGHDGLDPMTWIAELTRRLVDIASPRQLVFVGSSGGGFAALQASRLFANSLAFVTDPQTDVTAYHESQVKRLLHVGFDDLDPHAALLAHPDRLSAVKSYAESAPQNYIYYTQHQWDRFHVDRHLTPFAHSLDTPMPSETAVSESERMRVELIEKGRHGPLAPDVFETHLSNALDWHSARLEGV